MDCIDPNFESGCVVKFEHIFQCIVQTCSSLIDRTNDVPWDAILEVKYIYICLNNVQ